jgi:hypothetical protein
VQPSAPSTAPSQAHAMQVASQQGTTHLPGAALLHNNWLTLTVNSSANKESLPAPSARSVLLTGAQVQC